MLKKQFWESDHLCDYDDSLNGASELVTTVETGGRTKTNADGSITTTTSYTDSSGNV